MGSRSSTKALVDQARQVMTAIEYPALTTAEKKKLLLAFNLKCAFCGGLYSGPRVEPVDPAGLRVPGNLVPTCYCCRSYRRVNEGWRAFMARRVQGNTEKYERLAAQMETWLLANPLPPPMTSPVITAAHQRVEEALATIADACRDLRAECASLRRSQTQQSDPTADAEATCVARRVDEEPPPQPEGDPVAGPTRRSDRSKLACLWGLRRQAPQPFRPRPAPQEGPARQADHTGAGTPGAVLDDLERKAPQMGEGKGT